MLPTVCVSQLNAGNPGENPGRLRHCESYKLLGKPLVERLGRPERGLKLQVRIPVQLCLSVPFFSPKRRVERFSAKEMDEACLF